MDIVNPFKFAVGIVFALLGMAMLYQGRGRRGFNKKRQMGVLLIAAAAIFVAVGLGVDVKGMIGL